ncbi:MULTISPECIES: Spy/CpxP family protein refolding chaperone [Niastella]|uniref:Spy/CpxP family protein refolding chaperone n=1 Tax=Niastella soli TaxID=2821487 RepID=A0ABS3YSN3_9BACT|nr:Spy/CpxP family protein refolding chaperone [Niastella soli]MBO9200440.1 Spy/CpxP family protein refolding chaperone [Niastella soli]
MKRVFIGMALAALVATTACAQDQSLSNDRPKMHHHRDDAMAQLNLTESQKNELKAINDDFKQQMGELKKSEDKITVTEWKNKMATIRKDHHEKMEKVLTDEQKASLKTMHKEHGKRFRQDNHNRLERMKKELNLTDEQSAAVEKNLIESLKKTKAVNEDKSLTDDQKKAQFKTLHEQEQEGLKSILTPDQWKKYQEQKKNHRYGKPVQS